MFSDQVGVVSYAGGALIFFAFTLICTYSSIKRRSATVLLVPATCTTFACYYIAYLVDINPTFASYLPIVEIMKNGSWLVAILGVLKFSSGVKVPLKFHLLIHLPTLAIELIKILEIWKIKGLRLC